MTKNSNLEIYERLKKLYSSLNIDTAIGEENDAEIYAYSRMISKIKAQLRQAFADMFCENEQSLDMYIDLLDLNKFSKSYSSLLAEIKSRLNMNFGEFNRALFDKAIREVGCSYTIVDNSLYFKNVADDKLPILHKFIDGYKALFNDYHYGNNQHMNFNERDSYKRNWAYCDALSLDWDFLEEYRESK